MAIEFEISPNSATELRSVSGIAGGAYSQAAGSILASLGESRRVRQADLQESQAPLNGETENRSWREAETLLKDAELVVKATGLATAELLREIYVNDWLLREQ
jgi:hypothetical protein